MVIDDLIDDFNNDLNDDKTVVKHSATYYISNTEAIAGHINVTSIQYSFSPNLKCHLPHYRYQMPGKGSPNLKE